MKSSQPDNTQEGSSTRSACPDRVAGRRANPLRRAAAVAALLAAGWSSTTLAIERLVDTAPAREARVDLKWSPVNWRRGDADPSYFQMSADVPRVEYRLDVTRFVGRNARVFYVFPPDPGITAPQGLTVKWTAQNGVLRSGQARSGERTPVYEGRISSPVLDEFFDLQLTVDSRYFTGRFRLNPYFEIETY